MVPIRKKFQEGLTGGKGLPEGQRLLQEVYKDLGHAILNQGRQGPYQVFFEVFIGVVTFAA